MLLGLTTLEDKEGGVVGLTTLEDGEFEGY
jgi:hypothetical protein